MALLYSTSSAWVSLIEGGLVAEALASSCRFLLFFTVLQDANGGG